MGRVATPNLSLGCWLDGDNPGAGSQTVDNTGLNGNFLKIDTAVGAGHTTAGAHKNGVIDGPNLASTAVDATTVELSGAPLKIRLKALGITSGFIADGAVIAGKIATGGVSTTAQIADGIITAAKMVAGTLTATQVQDSSITGAKLAHDTTRTKCLILVATSGGTAMYIAGVQLTNTFGFCLGRAGYMTGCTVVFPGGTVRTTNYAYSASADTRRFTATDMITFGDGTGTCGFYKVGQTLPGGFGIAVNDAGYAAGMIATLEVELD